MSCSDASNQDASSAPDDSGNSEQTDVETKTGLQQNGDYSSLFNRADCKVITAVEISSLLGMTFTDLNLNNSCSFQSEFPDNKKWNLTINYNEMSENDMQREIESFRSDETGMLSLEMSETGDTYFCIQHSHGYFSMYNPNYDGAIFIRYGSVAESRGFSKEERLEHKASAMKLANELLRKHKA